MNQQLPTDMRLDAVVRAQRRHTIGLVVVAGLLATNLLLHALGGPSDVVEAHRFVLADADGTQVAELFSVRSPHQSGSHAVLSMSGPGNGKVIVSASDAPFLLIEQALPEGNRRVSAALKAATQTPAGLVLRDLANVTSSEPIAEVSVRLPSDSSPEYLSASMGGEQLWPKR